MTFGFASCRDKKPEVDPNFPTANMTTYGNGGLSVRKGNYLYFVNGYQSVADLENKSDVSNVHVGALMIARLDDEGNLVTDDNGQVKDDYLRVMSDKLCGFEATDLYVFGEYLYFTSPCEENDSETGEWAKNLVEFNRIKLDKSGKVENLYTSQVENSKLEYSYFFDGEDAFLLVYEKEANLYDEDKSNRLVRVKGSKSEEVLCDVTSVVMPTGEDALDRIFFVATVKENNTSNNVLYRYNVANNTKTEFTKNSSTIEVNAVTGGYVYCTFTDGTRKPFERSRIDAANFNRVCYADICDKVVVSPDAKIVVTISDTNFFQFYVHNANVPSQNPLTYTDEDATSVKVIGFVNGSLIYIDNSNNVKALAYSLVLEGKQPTVKTITTLTDVETDDLDNLDLDEEYLYFFKKVGSNKYLFRVLVNNNIDSESELVGKYLEDDIPEETEEEAELG